MLKISVLGSFRIEISGSTVAMPSKAKELIAYLLLQPNFCARRRVLASILWPDRGDDRGPSNLNTLLWRMKRVMKVVGRDFMAWDGVSVRLVLTSRDLIDLCELQKAKDHLRSGKVERSLLTYLIDLYKGDFYQDDRGLDWTIETREYFRVLFIETLVRAGEALEQGGDLEGAKIAYEHSIKIDPLNEGAARNLIRVLSIQGRKDLAARVFNSLSLRLRRELGVEPERETVEVFRQSRDRSFVSSMEVRALSEGSRELVLDAKAVERILVAIERSRNSWGQFIGVKGDWGTGKTLVAERFRELCLEQGFQVTIVTPSPIHEQFVAAVNTRSIRDLSSFRPTAIVVEDVHLLNLTSLRLLYEVRSSLRRCPAIFLLTWRDEDCVEEARAMLRSADFLDEVITLGPLDRRGMLKLLGEACLSRIGSDSLGKMDAFTGGNPFLVAEIGREVLSYGRFDDGLGRQIIARLSRKHQDYLRSVIGGRIARLEGDARDILFAACVLGSKGSVQLVAQLVSGVLRLDEILDTLQTLGFIELLGREYCFRSEFIREYLLNTLQPDVVVYWHRRAFAILKTWGDCSVWSLALHAEKAGFYGEASMYWETIGDAERDSGRPANAEAAYSRALNLARLMGEPLKIEVPLIRKRAFVRECLGQLDRADADLERLVCLSAAKGNSQIRAEGELGRGWISLKKGQIALARKYGVRLLRWARRNRDRRFLVRVCEFNCHVQYRQGNLMGARRNLQRLAAGLSPRTEARDLERLWTAIGRIELGMGLKEEALRSLERAERWAEGQPFQRALRSLIRGIIRYSDGLVDEARTQLELASRIFGELGDLPAKALSEALLACCYALAGDLREALRHARLGHPFKAYRGDVRWAIVAATHLVDTLFYSLPNHRLAKVMLSRLIGIPAPWEVHGTISLLLAKLALDEDRVASALELATEGLFRVRNSLDRSRCVFGALLMGRILLRLNRPAEAIIYLNDAIASARSVANHFEEIDAATLLAKALKAIDRESSVETSRMAISLLEAKGLAHPRPQEAYWNHYQILGDPQNPEAQHALTMAYALVERLSKGLGRRGRERFLRFPLNAAIVETWNKVYGPGSELPRGQAPPRPASRSRVVLVALPAQEERGRVARSAFVEVYWTVDSGETDERIRQVKGPVGLRRARILRLLAEADAQGARPREQDLARVLGVSVRTIRADIAALRAQGALAPARTVPRSSRRRRPPASAPVRSDGLPAVLPAANEMTV